MVVGRPPGQGDPGGGTALPAPLPPERMYRLLAEHSSDVILLSDTETDLFWVSPSSSAVLGWRPDELVGRRAVEFIHPDDVAEVRRAVARSASTGEPVLLRYRWRRPDGTWVWLQAAGTPYEDETDHVVGRVVRLRDITAEVDLIAALDDERDRLVAAIDSMLDPYVVLEPVIDVSGGVVDARFTLVNAAACRSLGAPRESLTEAGVVDCFGAERASWLLEVCSRTLQHGRPVESDGLEVVGLVDGEQRFVDVRAVATAGDVGITWRDVTARVRSQRELVERARIDGLTGALNRAEVLGRLDGSLHEPQRPGRSTAVLYCDLDELKAVNDTFGHSAGDDLLARVVDTIEGCVRDGDQVGRVGGDEILVVLDDVDARRAVQTAERIRASVSALAEGDDPSPSTTVSVGVAVAHAGEEAATVVDRADHAMYVAKRGGRDRVVLAD